MKLFPAHAGVIPAEVPVSGSMDAFPRPCGGDPFCATGLGFGLSFSPPMRG